MDYSDLTDDQLRERRQFLKTVRLGFSYGGMCTVHVGSKWNAPVPVDGEMPADMEADWNDLNREIERRRALKPG